jgi:prevent-host-death family protein
MLARLQGRLQRAATRANVVIAITGLPPWKRSFRLPRPIEFFSRVLREVAEGDTFTVTSYGRPIARIVPAEVKGSESAKRRLLEHLRSQPTTEIGPFKREELYDCYTRGIADRWAARREIHRCGGADVAAHRRVTPKRSASAAMMISALPGWMQSGVLNRHAPGHLTRREGSSSTQSFTKCTPSCTERLELRSPGTSGRRHVARSAKRPSL